MKRGSPIDSDEATSMPVGEKEIARYRKMLYQPTDDAQSHVVLAAERQGRSLWRWLGYVASFAAVVAAFVFLFVQFTNSLRVALVVVTLMLGYMFVMARMAEGSFDWRE